MADKTSTIANRRFGTAAPFVKCSFTVPDIDDADTVNVRGIRKIKHVRVFPTGTTAADVQVASTSGNTITFETGASTNVPVFVEALGYR